MKNCLRYARLAALPLLLLLPLGAQDSRKSKKDTGITSQQADQILDELRQIRQLLEQQTASLAAMAEKNAPSGPAHAKIDLSGFQMLGSKSAPVTLVEFTDYQCPYCRQFHVSVFNELKKNYIDTGKVRFYSRDLPLDQIHPNAMRAAEAGRCAADQGQFWSMRDLMGSNPDKLDLENLVAEAGTVFPAQVVLQVGEHQDGRQGGDRHQYDQTCQQVAATYHGSDLCTGVGAAPEVVARPRTHVQ